MLKFLLCVNNTGNDRCFSKIVFQWTKCFFRSRILYLKRPSGHFECMCKIFHLGAITLIVIKNHLPMFKCTCILPYIEPQVFWYLWTCVGACLMCLFLHYSWHLFSTFFLYFFVKMNNNSRYCLVEVHSTILLPRWIFSFFDVNFLNILRYYE